VARWERIFFRRSLLSRLSETFSRWLPALLSLPKPLPEVPYLRFVPLFPFGPNDFYDVGSCPSLGKRGAFPTTLLLPPPSLFFDFPRRTSFLIFFSALPLSNSYTLYSPCFSVRKAGTVFEPRLYVACPLTERRCTSRTSMLCPSPCLQRPRSFIAFHDSRPVQVCLP